MSGVGSGLTPRERDIAILVAAGLTNGEVAGRLGLSARTVEGGLRRVYARLGVQGRAQLRAWLALHPEQRPGGPHFRSGLPAEVSSFVGRDEELFQLLDLLAGHRLVTLLGPGGVGKTRLAIQVARLVPARSRLAVHLAELGRVLEPDLVDEAVAAGLGLGLEPGHTWREATTGHLGRTPALLVLDCCEHVIGAAGTLLQHLLRACPELRVLATSRQPLMISGEYVWPVQPLQLPAPEARIDGDALRRYSALRLFAERVREAGPVVSIQEGDLPTIARICRRLDGLPLALELAAARMRTLSPAALLAQLDDRDGLGRLVSGSRSAEERHRTLRATVAWSFQLLTEPERRLFARLSVFVGSFGLPAVHAVGSIRPGDAEAVVQRLSALVDRSLVTAAPGRNGEIRYRMLDTLRAFGRERLAQSGEHGAIRERHARHYAELLARPVLTWSRPALEELQDQLEDVQAALAWSCSNEPQLVTLICGKLVGFWGRHGHLGEACSWMARILDRLPADDIHKALALANATWLAQRHGRFEDADRYARDCLRIHRLLGGAAGIADALTRLADVARNRGDYDLARRCASDGLAIRRIEGSPEEIALSLLTLGSTLGRQGELEAGRLHLEEAQALFASIDEPGGVAYCHAWLGEVALRAGDLGRARALLDATLRGFRETPDAWMVANVLDLHAWLAGLERDGHRVLRLAGAAASARQAVGASQPPAITAALADVLREARRWLGARSGEAWGQGGGASFDHLVAYALREVEWRPRAAAGPAMPARLTARELDVVPLVARGLSDKEIAARLGISVRTAEYHVDRIRKKLRFASRSQIAAWAIEHGTELAGPPTPVQVPGLA